MRDLTVPSGSSSCRRSRCANDPRRRRAAAVRACSSGRVASALMQSGGDFLRFEHRRSAGVTSSGTNAGSFGSNSGRLSRRKASMRRLRAMVKIQVEAAPLPGSKRRLVPDRDHGLLHQFLGQATGRPPAAPCRPSPAAQNGETAPRTPRHRVARQRRPAGLHIDSASASSFIGRPFRPFPPCDPARPARSPGAPRSRIVCATAAAAMEMSAFMAASTRPFGARITRHDDFPRPMDPDPLSLRIRKQEPHRPERQNLRIDDAKEAGVPHATSPSSAPALPVCRPPGCSAGRQHVTVYESDEPARRPLQHGRRPDGERPHPGRYRLHRLSTSATIPTSSPCSTISASRRQPRTCRSRPRSMAAASNIPAPASTACSASAATSCARASGGWCAISCASTARRRRCCRARISRSMTLGDYLDAERIFRRLRRGSSAADGRGDLVDDGRATCAPIRCAPSSASSPATACSTSSTGRNGARSPAAAVPMSSGSRADFADADPPRLRRAAASTPRTRQRHDHRCQRADATRFNDVVIATHADQALRLLGDPMPQERPAARRLPLHRQSSPCCTATRT